KKQKKSKISHIRSWHNEVVIEEMKNIDNVDDVIQKKLTENNCNKEIKKIAKKHNFTKKRNIKLKKHLTKGFSISKENRITKQEYEILKDKHYPIPEIKEPYILIQPYYSETKRWELYLKDNLSWGLWKKGKSLHSIIMDYLKATEKKNKIVNPKIIINHKINKPIPKHRMSNLHYLATHC
ncbi:MAG: hypothetical protein IKW58_01465, partial [Alphaproteobacteria bacterium]|nr:hypothetical protein [Alphaproteobacteria bacterium]